jgi:mannose-6-phosphate isomerase-like protein (cupin superfamily)
MPKPVRRIVTGHDDSGKAIVVMDGPAPNQRVRQATGVVSTLLWVTEEMPVNIASNADRADRESPVGPAPRGSILRVVDFPPSGDTKGISQEAVLKEMGIHHDHGGKPARHPFTHRTRSVDYAFVLEGEIDMLLDDSEVHMTAGDIMVQQGTNHAWVNNGTQMCRIAFVLIDAEEPEAWKKG